MWTGSAAASLIIKTCLETRLPDAFSGNKGHLHSDNNYSDSAKTTAAVTTPSKLTNHQHPSQTGSV
ncbi:hypothetical protein M433DRAFT_9997 [Acidomyces richmondensis BFW]|nr:hypothetical protein M433DRAFT_9997 [Acidomyces richmondensis BFW]